jgi:hypothetical protein
MNLRISRRDILKKRDELFADRVFIAGEQSLEHDAMNGDEHAQVGARDVEGAGEWHVRRATPAGMRRRHIFRSLERRRRASARNCRRQSQPRAMPSFLLS